MTKASIGLQELRRKIYLKAKAEPAWRFWGLFVHVCKYETLHEAYKVAKRNGGAPGVDGVTFAFIELAGVESFLSWLLERTDHFRIERRKSPRMVARSAHLGFRPSEIG